jgi:hypothetical protein
VPLIDVVPPPLQGTLHCAPAGQAACVPLPLLDAPPLPPLPLPPRRLPLEDAPPLLVPPLPDPPAPLLEPKTSLPLLPRGTEVQGNPESEQPCNDGGSAAHGKASANKETPCSGKSRLMSAPLLRSGAPFAR